MELGSTRIKACLIGEGAATMLATGSYEWESEFVDGVWTYSLESVWSGQQTARVALVTNTARRFGGDPGRYGAIGATPVMRGYLALEASDQLLVPFRTWRDTTTDAGSGANGDLQRAIPASLVDHVPSRGSDRPRAARPEVRFIRDLGRRLAHRRSRTPHCDDDAVNVGVCRDFDEIAGTELLVIGNKTTLDGSSRETR